MNRTQSGGVLLVCDANVCRSPLAQFVIAAAFDHDDDFRGVPVKSAGVRVGETAAEACRLVGAMRDDEAWRERASAHRSREATAALVRSAGLVLTAARSSRGAIAALVPDARRNLFTMREALWLADGYLRDPERNGIEAIAAFSEHLDRNRGLRPLPAARKRLWRRADDPFDIEDGHIVGGATHPAALKQVETVATRLAELMMVHR